MSLIRKHGAVLQAWACLDLVGTSVPAKTGHQMIAQFPPHPTSISALPAKTKQAKYALK